MPRAQRPTGRLKRRTLKSGEEVWYAATRVPGRRPMDTTSRLGPVAAKGGRPLAGQLTRRMAEDALRDLLDAERRKVADGGYERATMPTVAEVADSWLTAKARPDGVREQTWRDYQAVLNRHLLPTFGGLAVDAIEPADLEAWKEEQLDEGMSARGVVKCLMVLSQVFTHAQRRHRLERNPAGGKLVPRPRVRYDRSRFNVLTPAQMRAVADAMPTSAGRAAVLVSAWTGVRIGELVELRWRDVAWLDERLHVRRSHGRNGTKGTKGGHGRSVPMIADLAALLDGLSQRDHSTGLDDLVLVDELGDRLNGWTLRRHFYGALGPAGLAHLRESDPPLRWHDLRHSFASLAVKVKPLSDVQALLGHAHITTTMRYVHSVPGQRDAELLGAAFAAADGASDPRTPAGAPNRASSQRTERT
ncbi:tyrosine-type recombinase/integrase [Candidatus Solirubrobacter pratensis]|uniref:tyrosine-type recombinase/integrase n=1 Tax=Candidatus Solirubrobacter pratensis TaxID=1298857 RepID=UPI0012DC4716|nr:site-specific integrase [Candidatus Solirubrobacter pratensis]